VEEINSTETAPIEQASVSKTSSRNFKDLLFFLSRQKRYLYIIVALAVLLVFFVPINGRSLIVRLSEWGKGKVVNLAPNPSFEKGSGGMPEGWATK